MAIRTWSFTKLWAVAAFLWLLSGFVGAAGRGPGPGTAVAMAISIVPAFLAGAWAGSHPEIRDWPLIRVFAIWFFPVLVLLGVDQYAWSEQRFIAGVLLAPVAVLTFRWLELRGKRGIRLESVPVSPPESAVPATTPVPR